MSCNFSRSESICLTSRIHSWTNLFHGPVKCLHLFDYCKQELAVKLAQREVWATLCAMDGEPAEEDCFPWSHSPAQSIEFGSPKGKWTKNEIIGNGLISSCVMLAFFMIFLWKSVWNPLVFASLIADRLCEFDRRSGNESFAHDLLHSEKTHRN